MNVADLRKRLGLSQAEFAARYGLSVATLQQWEHGRHQVSGASLVLLRLIEQSPGKMAEMIGQLLPAAPIERRPLTAAFRNPLVSGNDDLDEQLRELLR